VVGKVDARPELRIRLGGAALTVPCERLKAAWQRPLRVMET
jgi:hypothetical protein